MPASASLLAGGISHDMARQMYGQTGKQQPDADLDAGADNLTSRRRQSPTRSNPRQRIGLAS